MISFEPLSAALVAALASFAIGGLWFSPLLSGNAWLRELHVTGEPSRTMGAVLAVPSALGAAFGLGVLTTSAHITDVRRALFVGVLVWACFVVAIELPSLALEKAPRRFAIYAGHKLVVYLAMATVFGLWH